MHIKKSIILDLTTILFVVSLIISSISGLADGAALVFKYIQYGAVFFMLILGFLGGGGLKKQNLFIVILLLIWSVLYVFSALMSRDLWHGVWIYLNSSAIFLLLIVHFIRFEPNTISHYLNVTIIGMIAFIVLPSAFVLICGESCFFPMASQDYVGTSLSELLRMATGFRGVMTNQNTLGPILFLVLIWYVFRLRVNGLIFFDYLIISICLVMLALTMSRASNMALVLALIIYALCLRSVKLIAALMFIFGILFVGLNFSDFGDVVYGRFNERGLSIRDLIWVDALNLWLKFPFFGIGPNQYYYDTGEIRLSTHNEYLSILVNNGMFVFGIYIVFLTAVFFLLVKRRSSALYLVDFELRNFSIAVVAAVSFHQFFETGGFHPFSPTGIVITLIAAYAGSKKKGGFKYEVQ